jgi:hypothetical protein
VAYLPYNSEVSTGTGPRQNVQTINFESYDTRLGPPVLVAFLTSLDLVAGSASAVIEQ